MLLIFLYLYCNQSPCYTSIFLNVFQIMLFKPFDFYRMHLSLMWDELQNNCQFPHDLWLSHNSGAPTHHTNSCNPITGIFQSSFCFPALFLSHASLLYPHPGSCELLCLCNPLERCILIAPLYTLWASVHLGIQAWYYRSASLSSSEPCSPLQLG